MAPFNVFDALLYLLALIGILCLLQRIFGGLRFRMAAGEDGPIRVKGGTVTIVNDDDEWESDNEDGYEYHAKSQVRKIKLKAWETEQDWKDKKDPVFRSDGRKIELTVRRSSAANDFYIVTFRANGAFRVRDSAGELLPLKETLKDAHLDHWPELLVVIEGKTEKERYKFIGKTGFFFLKPVK